MQNPDLTLLNRLGSSLYTDGGLYLWVILMIWASIWKGIALWKAGRNGHKVWFVALFLLNTLGILEMIYIFLVSKKFEKKAAAVAQTPHA